MTMTLDAARARDAADPLRPFRDRFLLPDGVVYLDGNSLGALPAATAARIDAVVRAEWGRDLIASWNDHDWIGAPARIGGMIAPLIGAAADEVIVADSTSVNLFKLLVAACGAQPGRTTILTEAGNFPTDLHVAEGVARLLPDRQVRLVPSDTMIDAIDADTAVVLRTHVHYKTARRIDMAAIGAAARAAGALTLWDLSHSTGAVPLDLTGDAADLAVGCGYKYLNGGPGAPAFLFVRRGLQERLASPISGWMGHAQPFAFGDAWAPAQGMARFLAGTPPVLGMAALEAGVEIVGAAGVAALWAKSIALFDLFVARVAAVAPELCCVTPADPASRGSHVSFRHPQAYAIVQALIAAGVVGDFRAPDIARFGLTPLYLGFEDVWRATETMGAIMREERWRDPAFAVRRQVT